MAKRIVTREDVEAARRAGAPVEVGPGDSVTQAARDLAARAGVELREGGAPGGAPLPGPAVPPVTPVEPPGDAKGERAIVTAVGKNRPFVLAEITSRTAEVGGNIQDISQRIVAGYFSTVLVVDLAGLERDFAAFKADLEALSREGDYRVVVQHERIFHAMYRV